jgi:succinate dehydrogenase/fumarate reductase flavoprotein subunit
LDHDPLKDDKKMDYQANLSNGVLEWPYPIKYEVVNRVEVDILIVGGGLAGGMAGIAAARRGAKVAVVDKAPIRISGNGGAGMDHWNSLLSNPQSPMSPEENVERAVDYRGLVHRDYIAMKGTWDALLELEKLGLPIRDEDGDFVGAPTRDEQTRLLKAYDYRNMVSIKLCGGYYIKPVIYEGLKKEKNVSLYERVMVTCLLSEGGKQGSRVVGATGFSMETGEFYVFNAKSVILTTGYVCSCWIFSTEITGNSYRWDPNEIGEGLAMAWNAGAQVYGMHKAGNTSGSHPFAWPRFGIGFPSNTWFPCTIVDNNGKEVPWEDANGDPVTTVEARNLPLEGQPYLASGKSDNLKGVKMPGLIRDLPERIRKGEFELPLWADLSGMPEKERRSIWGMMVGNEGKTRYTLFDYYTREGFNPDTDMFMAPIMTPESYRSGAWFHGEPDVVKPWRTENGSQGEVASDWNLMTTVKGLFCAGATGGLEGCSFACSSGIYAGNRAVEFARGVTLGKIDEEQLAAEKQRVYAPIKRAGNPASYISWKELWAGSARVMQSDCGEYKTIPILKHGLMWLDSIKKHEMRLTYARNPHELARVLECETRITCSEVFLTACIGKIEAEKKGFGKDRYIFHHLEDGKVVTTYKDHKYWLKAPYAPTYQENYHRCRGAEQETE